MQVQRGHAGGGERGRQLLSDEAWLAETGDDDVPLAGPHQLERADEARAQPSLGAEDGSGLGVEDAPGVGKGIGSLRGDPPPRGRGPGTHAGGSRDGASHRQGYGMRSYPEGPVEASGPTGGRAAQAKRDETKGDRAHEERAAEASHVLVSLDTPRVPRSSASRWRRAAQRRGCASHSLLA